MLIRDRIEASAKQMTGSERKLAATLLADYPYAGLASIQKLAARAEVSAPSITRFVAKLGLRGYQQLQHDLIAELKEGQRSPVQLHKGARSIDGGYLADFTTRAAAQMSVSASAITEAQFERICHLLIDQKRDVYVLGGRISDSIAQHLSFHLRQTRKGVYHLPASDELWPEYLLRMRGGDVLFVADFRRYQNSLQLLAQKAAERVNAKVILMTDKWISPIARHASEILPVPIESGTLWDTYVPALTLIEAIVTRIAEDNFDNTKARIEAWDALRTSQQDLT